MTARHHVEQNRRGADVRFAVVAIICVAILASIVLWMQQLGNALRDANLARDQLAFQVQQMGGKPVAGPPGTRGDPGPAVTGPQGEPGPVGPTGPTGPPGPTGPVGQSGFPGAAGSTGPTGVPGAAATGAPGAAGAPGKDGADGKDGSNGRDGADGQPPAGWTYTDPAGVSYTCSPGANFDPTAPRYTCAPDAAPPSSPSPAGRGTLGLIALSGTAAYRRLQWSTNSPPRDRTPGRPVTTSQTL